MTGSRFGRATRGPSGGVLAPAPEASPPACGRSLAGAGGSGCCSWRGAGGSCLDGGSVRGGAAAAPWPEATAGAWPWLWLWPGGGSWPDCCALGTYGLLIQLAGCLATSPSQARSVSGRSALVSSRAWPGVEKSGVARSSSASSEPSFVNDSFRWKPLPPPPNVNVHGGSEGPAPEYAGAEKILLDIDACAGLLGASGGASVREVSVLAAAAMRAEAPSCGRSVSGPLGGPPLPDATGRAAARAAADAGTAGAGEGVGLQCRGEAVRRGEPPRRGEPTEFGIGSVHRQDKGALGVPAASEGGSRVLCGGLHDLCSVLWSRAVLCASCITGVSAPEPATRGLGGRRRGLAERQVPKEACRQGCGTVEGLGGCKPPEGPRKCGGGPGGIRGEPPRVALGPGAGPGGG
mmetsp:Transcript_19796/g.55851  ORF Transcript_19796/g.55851 Transcript_19796/m.55851 type:complete len:405 (-) Transcript_19796:15-1229(-)